MIVRALYLRIFEQPAKAEAGAQGSAGATGAIEYTHQHTGGHVHDRRMLLSICTLLFGSVAYAGSRKAAAG